MHECKHGDPRVPARIWAKLLVDPDTGCWVWSGQPNRCGYGSVHADGRKWRLHRYMFTTLVGPIPDGLVVEHRCHTDDPDCFGSWDCPHRMCGNPAHLEAITNAENIARQHSPYSRRTHCPAGHAYDDDNTIWYGRRRYCRTCSRQHGRDHAARHRRTHPDEQSAARARRYAANKDHEAARNRAWREANPERVAATHRARIARRSAKRAARRAAADRPEQLALM